ncbi:MAG: hypothetical protein KAW84_01470 [Thermoplasmata archaeon]|nr:hypothetical protein [Thermoplasmata archaeon]
MAHENDMRKLEILLEHWVEHNKSHSGDFKKWADRAKQMGREDISESILGAVEQMDRANESLLDALSKAGKEES